jgi:hypothetical protein
VLNSRDITERNQQQPGARRGEQQLAGTFDSDSALAVFKRPMARGARRQSGLLALLKSGILNRPLGNFLPAAAYARWFPRCTSKRPAGGVKVQFET